MSYYNPYSVPTYGYASNIRPEAPTPMSHDTPRPYGGQSYVRSDTSSYSQATSYSTPSIYSSNSGYSPPQVGYQVPSYSDRPMQYAQRPAEQPSSQWGGAPSAGYNGQYRSDSSSGQHPSNIPRQPTNMYGRQDVFSPVSERAPDRPESRTSTTVERKPGVPAQQGTGLVGVGIIFQQYDDGNMYIKSLVPVQFFLFARLEMSKILIEALCCQREARLKKISFGR